MGQGNYRKRMHSAFAQDVALKGRRVSCYKDYNVFE